MRKREEKIVKAIKRGKETDPFTVRCFRQNECKREKYIEKERKKERGK